MMRLLVVLASTALAVAGSATALGQTAAPVPSWTATANSARFPLLAPAPPAGFALQAIDTESPACDGQANALVTAQYGRADGAVIVIEQYDGLCDHEFSQDFGSIPLRGGSAMVVGYGAGDCLFSPDGAPCAFSQEGNVLPDGRGIVYDSGGVEVLIASNLAGYEVLHPLLETAPVVNPSPGLGPRYERLEAKVLRVTAPDQLTVRANGQVRGDRLAGVTAPRAKQCWAPQALRFAKRLFPAGRMLWLEDDPGAGKRYWAFRNFGDTPVPTRDPLNADLVEVGAARTAVGSWRHSIAEDQRLAREAKNGFWGKTCRGSFKPKPKPKPPSTRPVGFVSPSPRLSPAPSRPARSDIYNCSDFPLSDGTSAQTYLNLYPDDPSGLDGDGDGAACE